jgi:hypothetical protein
MSMFQKWKVQIQITVNPEPNSNTTKKGLGNIPLHKTHKGTKKSQRQESKYKTKNVNITHTGQWG